MTFRKDSISFLRERIILIISSFVSLAALPVVGWQFTLAFVLFFCFFIWLSPKMYNEYLTINDVGISCCKSKKQIWAYEWDAIARLQRSSRYCLPSMEIMIETVYRGKNC